MTSDEQKVVLITGAGRGIGAATAGLFARRGYAVVVAELVDEWGSAVADSLSATGAEAMFVRMDVTDPTSIRAGIAASVDRYGRLDVVVNNAGRNRRTPLADTDAAVWDSMLALNLSSVFHVCQAALPHLLASGGTIVNVASLVGLQGQEGSAAYAAAKGGVIALTKTLAIDLGPQGVRVNCLCPGDIHTPLYDEWLAEQPDPESALSSITARIPLGDLGSVDEAADAVVFLAENTFANGTVLVLDGGKQLG